MADGFRFTGHDPARPEVFPHAARDPGLGVESGLYRVATLTTDHDPEGLDDALRRALGCRGHVFTALVAGAPPRHVATWKDGALVPGRDADDQERTRLAAVLAEPRPAPARGGVVLIAVGCTGAEMALQLAGPPRGSTSSTLEAR